MRLIAEGVKADREALERAKAEAEAAKVALDAAFHKMPTITPLTETAMKESVSSPGMLDRIVPCGLAGAFAGMLIQRKGMVGLYWALGLCVAFYFRL
jgi:hypothetical protein